MLSLLFDCSWLFFLVFLSMYLEVRTAFLVYLQSMYSFNKKYNGFLC